MQSDSRHPLHFVVSALPSVVAGPLVILRQLVEAAVRRPAIQFTILVHDHHHLALPRAENINYIDMPRANRSYARRIWTEYVLLHDLSRQLRPDVWLSLNDTTPRVDVPLQAVYCHNALPCFRPTLRDMRREPILGFRALTYRWIYQFRARHNTFVFAQTRWFATFLAKLMGVEAQRLVCAAPSRTAVLGTLKEAPWMARRDSEKLVCFYPSLPRAFKNFEEAIEICRRAGAVLKLTVRGDENRYARELKMAHAGNPNIVWMGPCSHELVLEEIRRCDVVLFPSRLESFGLPMLEAAAFGKPLVLPIQPWTLDVSGAYERAHFYRNVAEGASILRQLAQGESPDRGAPVAPPSPPGMRVVTGFEGILDLLEVEARKGR